MIDYNLIDKSISYYETKGFVRIETPWTVSEAVCDLTKPKDKSNYKIEHTKKCLVASGEQSFMYLYSKGFLPKGKFQTVTPCFRDDLFSLIHTKYFIKNELIITDLPTELNLQLLFVNAIEFFNSIFSNVDSVKTDEGYDIVYKGIELGSYGIRENSLIKYIYGTGIAEPRTSYCLNLK